MANCICPKCGSKNIIPIMYGYPAPEAFEESEKGNIKLGGCVIESVDGYTVDRYCKDCEQEWGLCDFFAEDIVKVRFRYWSNYGFYSPESTEEGQWAYEIYPDGLVKYYSYPLGGRRVLCKNEGRADKEGVRTLYGKLHESCKPLSVLEEGRVLDGCSYELTLTYKDKRQVKHKGDIDGGIVDETVMSFIQTIPELAEDEIDYDSDHMCPVYGNVINPDLCYDSLMCLNGSFKVESVKELDSVEDIEAARKTCRKCPYSNL